MSRVRVSVLKCFSTFVPSFVLMSTRPKTVNPPFCTFRLVELSFRLKNHWLVAESGSPPSFAMAIVPKRLL